MDTKNIEPTEANRLLAAARYLHHNNEEEKQRIALKAIDAAAQNNKTPTGRVKKAWQAEIDKQESVVSKCSHSAHAALKVFAQTNWDIIKADRKAAEAKRDSILNALDNAIFGGGILDIPSARIDISREYEQFLKEHIRLMSKERPDYTKDRDFTSYSDLSNGQRVVYDLTQIVQSAKLGGTLYEEETHYTANGKVRQRGGQIRFHLWLDFDPVGELASASLYHGSVDEKPVETQRHRADAKSWSHRPINDSFGNSFLNGLNFAATGTKSEDETRAEAMAMLMCCDLARILGPFKKDSYGDWDAKNHKRAVQLCEANRKEADELLKTHGADVSEYLQPEEEDVDATATAQ